MHNLTANHRGAMADAFSQAIAVITATVSEDHQMIWPTYKDGIQQHGRLFQKATHNAY